MSHVSWDTQMNMQGFPICSLQDHLHSKPIVSTQQALSPSRSEWMCRGFPVSVMKALWKIIFQAYDINSMSSVSSETWTSMQRLPCISDECPVQDSLQSSILYWLNKFCLLGNLNEHADALLCQWWPPFTRPPCEPMTSTWWAQSPTRPDLTCRGFLV